MPQFDSSNADFGSPAKAPGASLRVDPSHAPAEPVLAPEAARAVAYSETAERPDGAALLEQIQSQATQLATRLRGRQRSLDHRESELNARLAALENEVRGARIWLDGEREQLAARTVDLDGRQQELSELRAEMNRRQLELGSRERSLEAREVALAEQLTELSVAEAMSRQQRDGEQAELQKAARVIAAQGEEVRDLDREREEIARREQNLEAGETILAEGQADLDRARQRLAHEIATFAEESASERERLSLAQRRAAAELAAERKALQQRGEQIETRRAALAELRAEITRAEREALEMRLATEELWSRMQATTPSAVLTRELSKLRQKLAERQQLLLEEVSQQRAELESLARKIDERHVALTAEKASLQAWAAERRQEFDAETQNQALNEQSLAEHEAKMRDLTAEWDLERHGYQQEIRRLLRQLRRPHLRAA